MLPAFKPSVVQHLDKPQSIHLALWSDLFCTIKQLATFLWCYNNIYLFCNNSSKFHVASKGFSSVYFHALFYQSQLYRKLIMFAFFSVLSSNDNYASYHIVFVQCKFVHKHQIKNCWYCATLYSSSCFHWASFIWLLWDPNVFSSYGDYFHLHINQG